LFYEKEIFYILHNDFASLCYILQQNNIEGILISILMDEVNREVEQITDVYRTGKKLTPEVVSRKRVSSC
jgi:hypothetical protein